MPSKFYIPTRRTPASGVTARPVPQLMAPERCIEVDDGVSAHTVVIVGLDLQGRVRIKVEVARDDRSAWLVKVIRHWLAWWCGASEIRIVS